MLENSNSPSPYSEYADHVMQTKESSPVSCHSHIVADCLLLILVLPRLGVTTSFNIVLVSVMIMDIFTGER